MSRHDLKLVLQLFFLSARLQKKRATLTIASLAWGTVTILLLLAFGEGLKRQMQSNEQAMGSNLAILWPGETSKPYKGLAEGRSIHVRLDDVDYVRERMPDLDAVWGELTSWRTALAYGRKTVNGRVIGTNPCYGDRRKHFPKPGGRFLDPDDLDQKRRVVFLGNELAKQLFGDEEPVGKTLAINNSPFTVIGVMQRKRQSSTYGGPDAQHAVIPETTFKALFGKDQLNVLVLRVKRPEEMDDALVRLNQVLGPHLGFDPEDPRVFGVWNTVEGQKMGAKILLGLELFFGIIGALTLIIGGVGVANIMYAVVKERTKEIGVKMAMGARRRWITGPFILEGLVYTLVGGLFGAFISIVIVTLLGLIPSEGNDVLEFLGKPTLSWPIGAATVAILGTAGLLAGYFPARRAASIDPASTLRYE
ncbi:MAG TPA: ABC transporter permease [Thermoanaerobaculia bacterium]|nr:ABC transporter permease [Thermoanaerobaculia bacterium]